MSAGSDLPDEILEAVRVIRELNDKANPGRVERENLNRAKLRIAYWVCRTENVVSSKENLAYILGPDAPAIMGAYDKYLEREDERKDREQKDRDRRRRGGGGTQFWESAQ